MVDIKGFEGLYGVTSCGKVWSYTNNSFLSTKTNKKGYEVVHLSKDGQDYFLFVHRLVALAYVPNPNNLETVDHIDNCKSHNYASNLQWLSRGDNARKSCSKKIYCVELDRTFNSQQEAARILHLDQGNISKVCRGKLRTTGGYHFEFVIEEEE